MLGYAPFALVLIASFCWTFISKSVTGFLVHWYRFYIMGGCKWLDQE